MQPALACPDISGAPPSWTAALIPLDRHSWLIPLGAFVFSLVLFIPTLWNTPPQARRTVTLRLCVMTVLLVAGAYAFVLYETWDKLIMQWAGSITSRPNISGCQLAAFRQKYDQVARSRNVVLTLPLLFASFGTTWFGKALNIRRATLAAYRSPDIPSVPDDLAARRAIPHRPYRRRGFHRRWR